jgi:hypothetical protein
MEQNRQHISVRHRAANAFWNEYASKAFALVAHLIPEDTEPLAVGTVMRRNNK